MMNDSEINEYIPDIDSDLSDIENEKPKLKPIIPEEKYQGRYKRFNNLYKTSVLDDIYEKNETELKQILKPVKQALYNHYKNEFINKVEECFLKINQDDEDFLNLSNDDAVEKINNIMTAYKTNLNYEVNNRRQITFKF